MKYQSRNGKKTKISKVILPGYVLFEAPDDDDIVQSISKNIGIRILRDQDGDWRLSGQDLQFAKWAVAYHGCINFSKAYCEGDRIKIISGPLKAMEGCITRIDKRGRSGQIALRFHNREIRLWLGFDLIEAPTDLNGEVKP